MIVKMDRAEIAEEGSQHSTEKLNDQAGYTMKLVAEDSSVQARAGEELIAEITQVQVAVRAAAGDRELADHEAQAGTAAVGDAVRAARVWQRELKAYAEGAAIAGEEVPRALLTLGPRTSKASELAESLRGKLALIKPALATLGPHGLDPDFVARGEALLGRLEETGASQRHKRLAAMPARVAELWYQKGLLYFGLKRLNALGQAVHAADPASAGRYNLSLLYAGKRRRSGSANGGGGNEPT